MLWRTDIHITELIEKPLKADMFVDFPIDLLIRLSSIKLENNESPAMLTWTEDFRLQALNTSVDVDAQSEI